MQYKVVPMNRIYAKEIISWRYEGDLAIYNLDDNEETLTEILTKDYYGVIDGKENLIGFFCTGDAAIVPYGKQFNVYDDTNFLDIKIGIKPELIGKRKGFPFVKFCLDFLKKNDKVRQFRLTVGDFNKKAISVYHEVGFIISNYFQSESGSYYLVMTLID